MYIYSLIYIYYYIIFCKGEKPLSRDAWSVGVGELSCAKDCKVVSLLDGQRIWRQIFGSACRRDNSWKYVCIHIHNIIISHNITFDYILYYYTYTYIYIYYVDKLQRPHCDLIGMMVSKGNHPQMALSEAGELLLFTQIYVYTNMSAGQGSYTYRCVHKDYCRSNWWNCKKKTQCSHHYMLIYVLRQSPCTSMLRSQPNSWISMSDMSLHGAQKISVSPNVVG